MGKNCKAIGFISKGKMIFLGYDDSKGEDETCLVVGRSVNGEKTIDRVLYGTEAVEEYTRLKGITFNA